MSFQRTFTDPVLRKRYGIAHRTRPRWIAPALVFALAGGLWSIWGAWEHARPASRTTLISFTIPDESHVILRYAVRFRDSTISHTCRIVARDTDKNIVGELRDKWSVGLNGGEHTVLIATRTAAVNGDVLGCLP